MSLKVSIAMKRRIESSSDEDQDFRTMTIRNEVIRNEVSNLRNEVSKLRNELSNLRWEFEDIRCGITCVRFFCSFICFFIYLTPMCLLGLIYYRPLDKF